MSKTKGTAAGFRKTLLDTFEGQKTLLKGTLQTFAVVLGEPFAAVFKPIVSVVVTFLNTLLRIFTAIPGPIKTALAGFVVVAGVLLGIAGAVIAAKGAFLLIGLAVKALGLSFTGLLATIWPVTLAIAAVSAAIALFKLAYEKNFGGFADFVDRVSRKLRLLWDGITQLFSQGGFSGAVREELGKAENSGLKRFLIGIFRFVHHVKKIFVGICDWRQRSFPTSHSDSWPHIQ